MVINKVGQIDSIRLTAALHSGLMAQLQVDALPSPPPLRWNFSTTIGAK